MKAFAGSGTFLYPSRDALMAVLRLLVFFCLLTGHLIENRTTALRSSFGRVHLRHAVSVAGRVWSVSVLWRRFHLLCSAQCENLQCLSLLLCHVYVVPHNDMSLSLISSPTDTLYSPANRETSSFVTIIKPHQRLCAPSSCCVCDGMCLSSAADFTCCVLRLCEDLECLSSATDNQRSPSDIMFCFCPSWQDTM